MSRSDVRPENDAGDVKLVDRHQRIAIDARVVIRDDQKNRIRPVVAAPRAVDELSERIVRILDRVVDGLLLRIDRFDAAVRVLERRMVGG